MIETHTRLITLEKVQASQITAIIPMATEDGWRLTLADGRVAMLPRGVGVFTPRLRDYYVVGKDGIGSVKEQRAFEACYTPMQLAAPAPVSAADAALEREIQAKGLTKGRRVTPDDIESAIAFECFFTAREGLAGAHAVIDGGECKVQVHRSPERLATVTICTLILRNGATVVGVNHGPVSPENFDAGLARKLARAKAVEQIWPLLGYLLLEELHQIRMDLQQEQARDH